MIEVSHLTKKYGSRLAVDDISFTVEDGVIYGLLGPNGAGKSTIMNILTGYLAATEGQVTVAGHPLPEEADAAKACVGYLPEQPPLYPEMTVAEYLDFAAELKGVKKADRPAQVQSAALRTGLEDVLPRLIRRADIALGLVQQHIEILVAGDVSAVQTDGVLVRLYVLVCLSHHSAVHGRLSLLDHLPQFPAGIHGACREKLI